MNFNKIVIDGKEITYNGGNLVVQNGRVFINGKEATEGMDLGKHVEIHVHGNTGSIQSDASVTVNGDVQGNVKADGSVTARDIAKSVDAGGSVHAMTITGDVDAGGSVKATTIHGDIDAGGSVRHG